MRGLRLPDVAAGRFFSMFRPLQARVAADLVVQFPPGITTNERATLVRSFETGRAHLFYTFILKLSAYSTPPLLLLASACHDTKAAHHALRHCLAADGGLHPRLMEFQAEPLKSQAECYLAGSVLEDLPELELAIANMRCGFAVERRVEGGHALVNRRSALASRRSEAFDSLALRMLEIRQRLEADPGFIKELAMALARARSPKLRVRCHGMTAHPSPLRGEQ